ncbi:MAG: 6-hydroxycyclohex-1-ene-1-carbonyl-CoA dehydrogenase [Saprospiraceae bacterium]|nr:6-hydroxycyclohex-1-ene-1-carbonyl-CoA dehydrogenase [Saprospiraceae bacterium]
MKSNIIHQWQMIEPNKELRYVKSELPELDLDEVLVKVAGCGVCHTDISYWHHGVKTNHSLPLTLGHEISGEVIKGETNWIGKKVIIPAVLPCGKCPLCLGGRSNICRNQVMPGNDFDGGFASHVKVPSRFLCEVPTELLERYSIEQLAVVADAISTPYQVVQKSELEVGDLAVVIGVGGVGLYGALIAKIFGACVIALDINNEKLERAKSLGVDEILNIQGLEIKTIKNKIKDISKKLDTPAYGWKIYEISGTKTGQELAFNLLNYASTLSIVGFTMDKFEVRLSNLMAFDAKIIGTWGCRAELYPEVLKLLIEDKLKITQLIQTIPMSKINEVFKNAVHNYYTKRPVLVPDFI